MEQTKPRTWSRKGRCPDCGVSTGSKHSKSCPWRFLKKPLDKGDRKIRVMLLDYSWTKWMSPEEFQLRVFTSQFNILRGVEIKEKITLKEAIKQYGYKQKKN